MADRKILQQKILGYPVRGVLLVKISKFNTSRIKRCWKDLQANKDHKSKVRLYDALSNKDQTSDKPHYKTSESY